MAEREAQLGLIVGRKGSGKTYMSLEEITDYLYRHNRKVLLIDPNDEFGNVKKDQSERFPEIRSIHASQIEVWVKSPVVEARRIRPIHLDGTKMSLNEIAQTLSEVTKHFKNGLLLIEDITKYVSDSLPNDLIGRIVTQRHDSVDILAHFQTVGKVGQPKLWGNANYIRMHKFDDDVERHKNKFVGGVDSMLIAEALVTSEYDKGNEYICVYLDKDDKNRLKGNFTLQQFDNAIEKYLMDNPTVVKKEVSRVELYTGKLVHKTRRDAVMSLLQEYRDTFYGNPK